MQAMELTRTHHYYMNEIEFLKHLLLIREETTRILRQEIERLRALLVPL